VVPAHFGRATGGSFEMTPLWFTAACAPASKGVADHDPLAVFTAACALVARSGELGLLAHPG
jgi:hypothetical protein